MRRATNFFICNLALTDLLFSAGIPFIITTRITREWLFGISICKLVTYVQFVSGICSILTLMVISIERFICVCASPRRKMTNHITAVVILGTWFFAVCFPIPVAIAQTEKYVFVENSLKTYCGVTWFVGFHTEGYLASMAVLFFLIPLLVISVNYYRIFRVVHTSSKRSGSQRFEVRVTKQIRLTKMFVAIVCAFVIMWLPFFVLSFLGVYLKQITSTHFTITIILALTNTCQNPIFYGYFNTKFRREFKLMCRCFLCRKKEEKNAYTIQTVNEATVTIPDICLTETIDEPKVEENTQQNQNQNS